MMEISVKQAQEKDLDLLTKMETEAFDVQARYFENGVLPPLPEEEKEQNSLTALFCQKGVSVLSVYADDTVVGCAAVKTVDITNKEILLFFISPEYQGKGLGRTALKMVEATFPDTKVWRLVTPTQVLRNSVFYVNKCGYKIVRVEDFDKRTEHGMFVFEKIKED